MEVVNPLLESVRLARHAPGESKRKRKPRSAIGLFKLLASYRGSVCILTIWYFQPLGNAPKVFTPKARLLNKECTVVESYAMSTRINAETTLFYDLTR